jgi:hypothetical protein
MVKRWWVNFDPAQDYFRFCHFWVLLSGLSLHFWHEKSLEAIGNILGKFICADLRALKANDRRICRVLVEIDIHSGLLESLEISWHGHHFFQPLDYLGIPFRCSNCQKMGHLWRDCLGTLVEEVLKGTLLDILTQVDSPEIESSRFSPSGYDFEDAPLPETTETITSKLKSVCPTLFHSLSIWERSFLDESKFFDFRTGNLAPPTLPDPIVKSVGTSINNLVCVPISGSVGGGLTHEDPLICSFECKRLENDSFSGVLPVRRDCGPSDLL